MKREYLTMYIEANGCSHIRSDKKGYSLYRNNGDKRLQSGVPAGENIKSPTVCLICIQLGIDPPEEVKDISAKISKIHARHRSN